jgi:hypothetical protein
MASPRAHRLFLLLLLSTVVVLTSACERPPYVMSVDFVNSTDMRLEIRVDGVPYPKHAPWVEPGGTLGVVTGRTEWERPRQVQAFDEQGKLRFERFLTEGDLDALNWRVVLQGDAAR